MCYSVCMGEKEHLTVAEVAKRLSLDPETIRRWLRAGRIAGVRIGAQRAGWRIPASEVKRVLKGE